jgi:hypothetical protein
MPRPKRRIQYAAASPYPLSVSGILDHPLSRMMTVVLTRVRNDAGPIEVTEAKLRYARKIKT